MSIYSKRGTYRMIFFFSSRRRHTRSLRDWSSDVCSSDLPLRDSPAVHLARGERAEDQQIERALEQIALRRFHGLSCRRSTKTIGSAPGNVKRNMPRQTTGASVDW